MNKWECQEPGCESTAVGVKSAVGLVAIGWYARIVPGRHMDLFCPVHRPDGIPCKEQAGEYDTRTFAERMNCSSCAAEQEALTWQHHMGIHE